MRRARRAIEAQGDVLDAFVIDGIRHNIPFLSALMAHPRWRAGKLSTGFIAEEFPEASTHIRRRRARPRAGCGRSRHRPRAGRAQAPQLRSVDRRGVTRESQRAVWLGEHEQGLEVKRDNGTIAVRFPASADAALHRTGSPANRWEGTIDAIRWRCRCVPIPNGFALSYRGVETKAYVYTEREAAYTR